MKVICKLVRPGGSVIELGGQKYHFKPEGDAENAPHVAEVTDKAALKRFAEIPEGYELRGDAPADEPTTTAATNAGHGEGDDDEPSDYLITNGKGEEVDLGKMTKAELLAFAKAEKIKVDAKLKSKADILKAVFKACTED